MSETRSSTADALSVNRVNRRRRLRMKPTTTGRPPRRGWRVVGVLAATLVATALGLIYPWLSRGTEAWLEAQWKQPWLLLGLLLVPPVWWFGTLGQDRRRPRLRIGTVAPLRGVRRGLRTRLRDLPGVVRAVAVVFLVLAMARPVSVLSDQSSAEEGIDIMVVMDVSGSMRAILDADPKDLPRGYARPDNRKLTRLDTAKIVVQDFISRRRTDRIGFVAFGEIAAILTPPTLDYQLLSQQVAGLQLGVVGANLTAIGDALGTAVARMRHSDALSKVIILITDGVSNAGEVSPDYAMEIAATMGCKVYTIQIGSGEEVEVFDRFDMLGQPVYSRASHPTNPELLQRIADKTGGEFFLATNARGLAESMHSILDRLEKTRFEASMASFEDLFALLLIPGVFLVGLDALLRAWLLRRFP